MHGSVNQYFDVTPVGRVIQRFTNELNVFRQGMINSLTSSLQICSKMSIQVSFFLMVSLWTLPMLIIIIVMVSRIFFFAKRVEKKLNRLRQVQSSPQVSFIQSTILGKEVIRAFGKEQVFIDKQVKLYECNEIISQAHEAVETWKEFRRDTLLLLVRVFGMAVCVMKKGVVDYDAVTLVLVLQYTAEMGWINSIFGRFLMIQNQLRRAGEFLDLDRIPQEQYKAKQN